MTKLNGYIDIYFALASLCFADYEPDIVPHTVVMGDRSETMSILEPKEKKNQHLAFKWC